MTGQVTAHKPLRSAPESEVRDSYFYRFWEIYSCLNSLILKMCSPQIQEGSLSRFRLTTEVPLWAGMWSHRRLAAASWSTTPSSTAYRKGHSSVSPPQTSLQMPWRYVFLFPFVAFLSWLSSRCYCKRHRAIHLFERSETRHPIQRLRQGHSSHWNH